MKQIIWILFLILFIGSVKFPEKCIWICKFLEINYIYLVISLVVLFGFIALKSQKSFNK